MKIILIQTLCHSSIKQLLVQLRLPHLPVLRPQLLSINIVYQLVRISHGELSEQPSAIAHVELEKVTEKDDSDSSNRPDDDVDDDYSIDLKGTDSMSMGEEEVNELLKNQESSLIELTNARQEHTDNPIVDIQSILTETEHVSTFNTSLL